MSCQDVAHVLLYDDDTIRGWRKLFEQRGLEGITSFDVGGSASYLSVQQEDDLKAWVGAALPRSTRRIGAWIEQEFGLVYASRSGLIALLHRLGLEYHKPDSIPRKLDKEKQQAFIESYDNLLNSLSDNEAVLFADAVHPTHAARPAGCWAPKQETLAIEQTSGRSSGCGASCTETSRTTNAMQLAPNSPMRPLVFCVKKFPATGRTSAIRSLTISASSTQRIFGL
jgi:transposase